MDDYKIKKSLGLIISENKEYIYPALFYLAGIITGSFCFNMINTKAISKLIEIAFEGFNSNFVSVFLNRFSLYFSVYVICVFLGMCLIGFPIINLIPLLTGFELALKVSYYYVNHGFKGVGFSLLMIIPEGAAVATVLIYAIKTSSSLSKNIYKMASNNDSERISIKSYFKSYLIYGLIVALISLINAIMFFLLSSIIKI